MAGTVLSKDLSHSEQTIREYLVQRELYPSDDFIGVFQDKQNGLEGIVVFGLNNEGSAFDVQQELLGRSEDIVRTRRYPRGALWEVNILRESDQLEPHSQSNCLDGFPVSTVTSFPHLENMLLYVETHLRKQGFYPDMHYGALAVDEQRAGIVVRDIYDRDSISNIHLGLLEATRFPYTDIHSDEIVDAVASIKQIKDEYEFLTRTDLISSAEPCEFGLRYSAEEPIFDSIKHMSLHCGWRVHENIINHPKSKFSERVERLRVHFGQANTLLPLVKIYIDPDSEKDSYRLETGSERKNKALDLELSDTELEKQRTRFERTIIDQITRSTFYNQSVAH